MPEVEPPLKSNGSESKTNACGRGRLCREELATKYPESFDASVPEDLVYSGKYALTDVEPETGMTVGKLVLSPTRTYAPVVKKLLDTMVGAARAENLFFDPRALKGACFQTVNSVF